MRRAPFRKCRSTACQPKSYSDCGNHTKRMGGEVNVRIFERRNSRARAMKGLPDGFLRNRRRVVSAPTIATCVIFWLSGYSVIPDSQADLPKLLNASSIQHRIWISTAVIFGFEWGPTMIYTVVELIFSAIWYKIYKKALRDKVEGRSTVAERTMRTGAASAEGYHCPNR